MEKIETIVKKEIQKVNFPGKATIKTSSRYSIFRRRRPNVVSIEISFKSKTNETNYSSFLDFSYCHTKKLIDEINIQLNEELRGNGYGRDLVYAMERIAKNLECTRINPSIVVKSAEGFWKNLGYEKTKRGWYKNI